MYRDDPALPRRPIRVDPAHLAIPVASLTLIARVVLLLVAMLLVSLCMPAAAQTDPMPSPFVLNPLRISEAASGAPLTVAPARIEFSPSNRSRPQTLRVSAPSDARTVEIGKDAPAPAAYADLSHAAAAMRSREIGASVLRALDARFSLALKHRGLRDTRTSGLDGVANRPASLPPGRLHRLGAEVNSAPADRRSLRWTSWPSTLDTLRDLPWSAWLVGDTAGMAAAYAGAELDGSLDVLHLAVETAPRIANHRSIRSNPWVAGIGVGFANGHMDYTRGGEDAGTGRVDLVTFLTYPYLGYRSAKLSGYVTAGGGTGTSTFSDSRFEPVGSDQDHALVFLGAGASLPLVGARERMQTLLRGSAVATRTSVDSGEVLDAFSVSAHQLRVGLESRYVRRTRIGTMVPNAGIAFRHFAGDDPAGAHFDASLGIDFTSGRLHLSGYAGRALFSAGDTETDWRAGVNARLVPRRGGRGLSLALSPSWGLDPSLGGVFDGGSLVNVARGAANPATIGTEIGYGFHAPALRGFLTPFVSHRSNRGAGASVDVGVRYRASSAVSFELRAAGRMLHAANRDQSLSLRGRISF